MPIVEPLLIRRRWTPLHTAHAWRERSSHVACGRRVGGGWIVYAVAWSSDPRNEYVRCRDCVAALKRLRPPDGDIAVLRHSQAGRLIPQKSHRFRLAGTGNTHATSVLWTTAGDRAGWQVRPQVRRPVSIRLPDEAPGPTAWASFVARGRSTHVKEYGCRSNCRSTSPHNGARLHRRTPTSQAEEPICHRGRGSLLRRRSVTARQSRVPRD